MSLMNPKARGVKSIQTQWSCPWFDVIKFKYGKQTHYRIRTSKDGAMAIIIRKDGKFVMVKMRRPSFDKPKLEILGGGIEKNETPEQTIIREIAEETGYKVLSIKPLVSVAPLCDKALYNGHCFVARVGNRPEHDPIEKDLPDAKVMVMGLPQLLRACRQGKVEWVSLSLLLYYLQFKK